MKYRRRIFAALGMGAISAGLISCGQSSIESYARQCAAEVGEVPAFSCADGVVVPVTQNGHAPSSFTKNMTCDHPGLLPNAIADGSKSGDGQCVPYSRILDLSTHEMQVSVMCRQKVIRTADSLLFDEIDVIAHNPVSGATCWFQATKSDGSSTDGNKVPSPTSATDDSFWRAPEHVLSEDCGGCHDNDPFMYSPFVGQVWANVPVNPFGAYYHVDLRTSPVGFSDWPTQVLNLRDSTCLGCHRIGMQETCGLLTLLMTGRAEVAGADVQAKRYPATHSMPPHQNLTEIAWNHIYDATVDTIVECCSATGRKRCDWTKIPEYIKSETAGE